MKKTIYINEINPHIRYASYHDLKPGYDSNFRHLRHYQIIYIVKGRGEFVTPTNSFEGRKGNLFFWSSQEAHRIISSREYPLTVFGLQFDLTKEAKDSVYPISWFTPRNYKEKYANENIDIFEIPQLSNMFYIDNISFYEGMLFELVKEYRSKLVNSIDICESILKTLLIYTFQNHMCGKPNKDKVNIQLVIQFIHNNIERKLMNKDISDAFNYHPNHLNRLFKNYTNMSLHQFVIDAKLNKAIEYIQMTDLTLSQISDKLAFSSIHHFSKQFKDKIGRPPSSFYV